MKQYVCCSNSKRSNQAGYISALALLILSLFVAAGIAILDNEQAIMKDATYLGGRAQAKFLAESAVQKGKYHIMHVNSSFTGESPVESLVSADGRSIGSYSYNVISTGSQVTSVRRLK